MDKKEFSNKIKELFSKNDIILNDEHVEKFYSYMNLLIEWNEKVNLTAIVEPLEVIKKHFFDSVILNRYLNKNEKIIDVGTGAGFPGIPLAIINKNINITLVDSLNKRIVFLNEVKERLDLKNIEVFHARVEEFGKNKKYREKFDVATSRAVSNLTVLSEYMIPLIKIGGKCLCMKGPNIKDEINGARNAIEILGGNLIAVHKEEIIGVDFDRNIIEIEKNKSTPSKYPRKPGMAQKEPIL